MSFRDDEDIDAGQPHGTACAEIIHDVAPEASLYLVNFNSLGFYEAMDYLIAQEVDIISFSMSFFGASPGDGTGSVCEKVDETADAGILFVKSAGNYATQHYEATFLDVDSDQFNEFDVGDETINILANAGEVINIYLSWSASWPTYEDYDLLLLDSSYTIVDSSQDYQSIVGLNPVESISYSVNTTGVLHIVVAKYSTTSDARGASKSVLTLEQRETNRKHDLDES